MNANKETISEITRERIFGLYAGQSIMASDCFLTKQGSYRKEKPILQVAKIQGVFLHVKPLWEITKEDAMEAVFRFSPYANYFRREINWSFIKKEKELEIVSTGERRFHFKMCFISGMIDFVKTEQGEDLSNNLDHLSYFDYLRSKGYALPAFGYSVEELRAQSVFWLSDCESSRESQKDALIEQI